MQVPTGIASMEPAGRPVGIPDARPSAILKAPALPLLQETEGPETKTEGLRLKAAFDQAKPPLRRPAGNDPRGRSNLGECVDKPLTEQYNDEILCGGRLARDVGSTTRAYQGGGPRPAWVIPC